MTVTDLQARLDEAREKAGVVGASLAVLHDGEVSAAASGVLNKATGAEATTDSLFQIGSITKTYTATLVMQLVEQGTLELDAPVTDVLPAFRVADAATTPQITLRHLLTHTSGFDGDHFADHGRGDDVLERYTASCSELSQTTPIGALFSYNNAGFSVLGRVVEVATGQVWDAALRERLLAPLGLDHSATLPEDVLRFGAAMGHIGPDLPPGPQWGLPRSVGPAGLICATATDLVGFARSHLEPGSVLSAESIATMQQPVVRIPGPAGGPLPEQQALGWMLSDLGGVRVVGHDGGTIGQSARLRFVPETGTAVALLTNGGDAFGIFSLVDELLKELTGAVPHGELEPPTGPVDADLSAWTGRYARNNQSVEVRVVDGALMGHHEVSMGGVIPVDFSAELVPYDADGATFLTRLPQLGDHWMPVSFLEVPGGRRVLHMGGRATPLVSP
jgi:CubicO group peptidase (beta-lactamase class C family)